MKIKKIYDNGGKTFDRYSVIYLDGWFLGLSHNPQSPQGFSRWTFEHDYIEGPHLGKEIKFKELPKAVKLYIKKLEEADLENGL